MQRPVLELGDLAAGTFDFRLDRRQPIRREHPDQLLAAPTFRLKVLGCVSNATFRPKAWRTRFRDIQLSI